MFLFNIARSEYIIPHSIAHNTSLLRIFNNFRFLFFTRSIDVVDTFNEYSAINTLRGYNLT